jgi:heme-degrading monooxygenase HmoA
MHAPPGACLVVFLSRRTHADDAGYAEMSERMVKGVAAQPGFLAMTSVREGHTRDGITVAVFASEADARAWHAKSVPFFVSELRLDHQGVRQPGVDQLPALGGPVRPHVLPLQGKGWDLAL